MVSSTRNPNDSPVKTSGKLVNWKTPFFLGILIVGLLVTGLPREAKAQTFTSPVSLPNADPYDNLFPKLLQLDNGSVWMVWEKVTASGHIFLMANNGFGWGGETLAVANTTYDDITPSIAQLNNGSVILAWSRGTVGNPNNYTIFTETYSSGQWSNPTPLVTASPPNFNPVLTTLRNGAVWLVWSRALSTNGNGDLYYKVLSNGSWSSEQAIPGASTPAYEEKLPSITQTWDGKVWVLYESNAMGTPQIYAVIYNGSWASPVRLTSTSNTDKWPSIVQDRNGTIWAFWARELPNGTTPPPDPVPAFEWDVFYKTSADNGTTWGPDTDLYPDINTDKQHPTIIQGPDKELWTVFDSCCMSPGNPYGSPNLFIVKSSHITGHDLAITSMTSTITTPRIGEAPLFTVVVSNLGDYSETSNFQLSIGSTLVANQALILDPRTSFTLSFAWNSTYMAVGHYNVSATVSSVPHEVNIQNNFRFFSFLLTYRGDVNRDGRVNISDLVLIGSSFGTTRGSSQYIAAADLNNDGIINITDLVLCAGDFGNSVS